MRRIFLLLLLVSAIWSLPSAAQTAAYLGSCTLGGQATVTSGLRSSGTVPLTGGSVNVGAGVQASYPSCTVTVNIHGGALATIFSNASNNPLANPFTANTDGSFTFYAAVASHYDVTISGGTMPHSFIFADVVLGGGGGGGGGGSVSLQTNGTPNTSQAVLNLKNGTATTLSSDGVGGVTINADVTSTNATSIQGNPVNSGTVSVPGSFYAGITGTNHFQLFAPGWIDPRFYGAVCDNVTNDAAAFQAMFNANPGGKFMLPGSLSSPRTCYMGATTLLPKGTAFVIEGGGSSYASCTAGGTCLRWDAGVPGLNINQGNVSGGTVRGVGFMGGEQFVGAFGGTWPDAILPNFTDQVGFNPYKRSFTSITRSGNVTTVQTTGIANEIGCHTYAPGTLLTIAGNADSTFNGLFYVTGVSNTQNGTCFDTFTYANPGSNGSTSGGTSTPAVTGTSTADGIIAGSNYLRLENVSLSNWGRYGVNCTSDSVTYWCDNVSFKNVIVNNGRGAAVYVRGADSNAGDYQQVGCQVTLAGGILDLGFLGNTWLSPNVNLCGGDNSSVAGATKAITSNSCTSNVCTITTSVAHGLNVGNVAVLAGQVDSTFNTPSGSGAFVATVTDATHFTVNFPHANGSTSGGTSRLATGPEVFTAGGTGQNAAGTVGSGYSYWISGLNNTRTVIQPYCEGASGPFKFGGATIVTGGANGCVQAAGFSSYITVQNGAIGGGLTNTASFDANINNGTPDFGTNLRIRGGHNSLQESSLRWTDQNFATRWMINDNVTSGILGMHLYRGDHTNPRLDLYDPAGINSVPGWTVLSSEGNGTVALSPQGTGSILAGYNSGLTYGGFKVSDGTVGVNNTVASIDRTGAGTFANSVNVTSTGPPSILFTQTSACGNSTPGVNALCSDTGEFKFSFGNTAPVIAEHRDQKGIASGYAGLDGTTRVPTPQLGTGVASNTTFLRGDQTWASPSAAPTGSTLLNFQASTGSITGTGAATDIFSFTIPANTIAAGKCIRITTIFTHTTGTASTTYSWQFGGGSIGGSPSSANTADDVWSMNICNNPSVTNAQTYFNDSIRFSGSIAGSVFAGTSAVDTTANQTIKVRFNVANTDAITGKFFMVESIQ